MTPKTWFLLIVALVCGVAASFCVKSIFFVEKDDQETDAVLVGNGAKERTLVANVFLPTGTELTAQNVRFDLLPESQIPRNAVFSFDGFAGRKTLRDVPAGEPISLYDLELEEEAAVQETTFVPPGCSIVPIEIQTAIKSKGNRDYLKTTTLDQILKPGDVLDLAVVKEDALESSADSFGATTRRPRLKTTRVVEGVEVFGVVDEKRFASEAGKSRRASIVSVLLSAEQLKIVRKAAEEGKIKALKSDGRDDEANAINLNAVLSNPSFDHVVSSVDAAPRAVSPFSSEERSTTAASPESANAFDVPMNDGVVFPTLAEIGAASQTDGEGVAIDDQANAPDEKAPLSFDKNDSTDENSFFEESEFGETFATDAENSTTPAKGAASRTPTRREFLFDDETPNDGATDGSFRKREPFGGASEFVEVSASSRISDEIDDKNFDDELEDDENALLPKGRGVVNFLENRAENAFANGSTSETDVPPIAAPAPQKYKFYSPFVTKNEPKTTSGRAHNR